MQDQESAVLVRLEAAQATFRAAFLGWQCRLRQHSIRKAEGRPSSGMQPEITLAPETSLGHITVLLVPDAPEDSTAEFRHMVRRTHDPNERYKAALKYLAAHYYQYPEDFSDRLTALFGPGSEIAERLLESGAASLRFAQYSQSYELPCRVIELPEAHTAFQATFWHNSLFNAAIPAGIRVLEFAPDWAHAKADPPVD